MDYKLTKEEMETTINFNEAEPLATIYTCSGKLQKRLDEMAEDLDEVECVESNGIGKSYILPKKFIAVHRPRRLTDEQKEAARERARNMLKKGD